MACRGYCSSYGHGRRMSRNMEGTVELRMQYYLKDMCNLTSRMPGFLVETVTVETQAGREPQFSQCW